MFMYNSTGTMMNSVDVFRINISGKGAHGAYPQNAIDPINIGVHIYLALEALIAREADPSKSCVMTIGQFEAGTAANIIPDESVLSGTIRTNDIDEREKLVRRMKETAAKTAEAFGGEAKVTMISEVAPLICDRSLTEEMAGYMNAAGIPDLKGYQGASASASEDFASIAERVPAAFMYLSSGYADERGDYPAHNPKVLFAEGVCPIGAACYAHCAFEWLKNNR
jgi:amidohydrolase